MGRRTGSRRGVPPLRVRTGTWGCLGCGEGVPEWRLACPRCWNRLPPALRERLAVPAGVNPHLAVSAAQGQAQDQARAFLRRGIELTEAAMAREASDG